MLFLLNILRIIVQETICMCVTISIIEIKHLNPGKNVIHVDDIGKGKKKGEEKYIIPRRLSHSISFHYFILLRQIGNERRREGRKKKSKLVFIKSIEKKKCDTSTFNCNNFIIIIIIIIFSASFFFSPFSIRTFFDIWFQFSCK
jgi:hypothetical protein